MKKNFNNNNNEKINNVKQVNLENSNGNQFHQNYSYYLNALSGNFTSIYEGEKKKK